MRIVAWSLVAVIAACGAGGDAGSRTTVRDSAGIRIVENVSPDDSAANVWWTIGAPRIDIGGADAQEPYALYRVVGALRTADGGVAVASQGAMDVRFFDASGTYVRTAGRKGGGPGEFNAIGALIRADSGTMIVLDPMNRRMTVLSEAGDVVREISLAAPNTLSRVLGRFSDGTLLSSSPPRPESMEFQNGHSRPDVTLGRYAADGVLIDTIGTFPGAERFISVTTTGGEITSVTIRVVPFAKNALQAVFGAELFVGPQTAGEILVHDLDGKLTSIIRTGRVPDRVTEQHLEAEWQRRLASAPPQLAEQMRAEGRTDGPHGDIVPPYSALMMDREGNLWVADYDDPLRDQRGRWTIYGRDGAARARIVLPPRFQPYDIGPDWILGRELDELDVEHVRLYPLATSETAP